MKTCTGCDESKPLAEFHKSSRNRDGRQSRCAECQRQAVRKIRKNGAEDPVWSARKRVASSIASARRRAREFGVEVEQYTLADLEELWGPVQGWRCLYCNSTDEIGLDHIVPLSGGGIDKSFAVVPACRSCNFRKHTTGPVDYVQTHGLPGESSESEFADNVRGMLRTLASIAEQEEE